MAAKRVVVITGCDSGLGWAMAARAAREGAVTVAGVLQGDNSPAAEQLKAQGVHCVPLDVTSADSVANLADYVRNILKINSNYVMHALVNNAGIMTFGEFEWMTPGIIEDQVSVNMIGTFRVTNALLPSLRRAGNAAAGCYPRIITVGSHCGIQPLPTLSVYSSTKSALMEWCKALRLELLPRGVQVVTFIPGSFVMSSHIMAQQGNRAAVMRDSFDEEQANYYGKYFDAWNNHLKLASQPQTPPDALKDDKMMELFVSALFDDKPRVVYKHEPWRYTFYYTLFKLPIPDFARLWLMKCFMFLPKV